MTRLLVQVLFFTCILSQSNAFHLVEDMSIDAFLDYVNPPALHKYKDEDGDSFLCVKFEDQLSIRLRNKDINQEKTQRRFSKGNKNAALSYKNETWCPEKTLALREVTRDDVRRAGGVKSFLKKPPSPSYHTTVGPEQATSHEYAVVEYRFFEPMSGTSGIHSVWKPAVAPDGHFTVSQVWVSEHMRLESIEAGWHVHPGRYGDDKPRFFVYWTADRYESTGCYNTLCPGFVVIDETLLRGKPLKTTNYMDSSQYEMPITINLAGSGPEPAWHLSVYGRQVGYWPVGLFGNLGQAPSLIVYGGEVSYNAKMEGEVLSRTEMGSGHFAAEGWGRSANIRQITFYKMSNNSYTKTMTLAETPSRLQEVVVSNPNCYDASPQHDNSFGGNHLFYGGPGGGASQCLSST